MDSTKKELLDIDLIEAVVMLSVLAEGTVYNLQQEQETSERWRRKKAHVSAVKIISEAIESMAINPDVHTIKEWLLAYERKRGSEWVMEWGDWFWNVVEQAVMYAQNYVQGTLM